MMLSWIPFRSESLDVAINMWAKVFNPYLYGSLGMRENIYLATAVILVGIFTTYWVKHKLIPSINPKSYLFILGEVVTFTIIFSLVVVFFRPINQFIYFQF